MLKSKVYQWLINISKEGKLPNDCQAIYIGLFENKEYMMHFLGSTSFDKENDDWACQSNIDYFPKNRYLTTGVSTKEDWIHFLNDVISIISELKNNDNLILSETKNIAVGFDSGDLTYL